MMRSISSYIASIQQSVQNRMSGQPLALLEASWWSENPKFLGISVFTLSFGLVLLVNALLPNWYMARTTLFFPSLPNPAGTLQGLMALPSNQKTLQQTFRATKNTLPTLSWEEGIPQFWLSGQGQGNAQVVTLYLADPDPKAAQLALATMLQGIEQIFISAYTDQEALPVNTSPQASHSQQAYHAHHGNHGSVESTHKKAPLQSHTDNHYTSPHDSERPHPKQKTSASEAHQKAHATHSEHSTATVVSPEDAHHGTKTHTNGPTHTHPATHTAHPAKLVHHTAHSKAHAETTTSPPHHPVTHQAHQTEHAEGVAHLALAAPEAHPTPLSTPVALAQASLNQKKALVALLQPTVDVRSYPTPPAKSTKVQVQVPHVVMQRVSNTSSGATQALRTRVKQLETQLGVTTTQARAVLPVLQDAEVMALRAQWMQTYAQWKELSAVYTAKYPKMADTERALGTLKNQLEARTNQLMGRALPPDHAVFSLNPTLAAELVSTSGRLQQLQASGTSYQVPKVTTVTKTITVPAALPSATASTSGVSEGAHSNTQKALNQWFEQEHQWLEQLIQSESDTSHGHTTAEQTTVLKTSPDQTAVTGLPFHVVEPIALPEAHDQVFPLSLPMTIMAGSLLGLVLALSSVALLSPQRHTQAEATGDGFILDDDAAMIGMNLSQGSYDGPKTHHSVVTSPLKVISVHNTYESLTEDALAELHRRLEYDRLTQKQTNWLFCHTDLGDGPSTIARQLAFPFSQQGVFTLMADLTPNATQMVEDGMDIGPFHLCQIPGVDQLDTVTLRAEASHDSRQMNWETLPDWAAYGMRMIHLWVEPEDILAYDHRDNPTVADWMMAYDGVVLVSNAHWRGQYPEVLSHLEQLSRQQQAPNSEEGPIHWISLAFD